MNSENETKRDTHTKKLRITPQILDPGTIDQLEIMFDASTIHVNLDALERFDLLESLYEEIEVLFQAYSLMQDRLNWDDREHFIPLYNKINKELAAVSEAIDGLSHETINYMASGIEINEKLCDQFLPNHDQLNDIDALDIATIEINRIRSQLKTAVSAGKKLNEDHKPKRRGAHNALPRSDIEFIADMAKTYVNYIDENLSSSGKFESFLDEILNSASPHVDFSYTKDSILKGIKRYRKRRKTAL